MKVKVLRRLCQLYFLPFPAFPALTAAGGGFSWKLSETEDVRTHLQSSGAGPGWGGATGWMGAGGGKYPAETTEVRRDQDLLAAAIQG